MSLTGFSLFSAHCAADIKPDAAAKSFDCPKETLRNFMRISGRIHGAAMSLQTKHIYEFGLFRLDEAEHLLLRDGEAVPLTPKAFDLLLALVERHGHLLEKDELLKKVWKDTFVEEANLASNISQLRKALGDGENGQRYIETAPKRGYRFVANVKKVVNEYAELMIQEQPGSQSTVVEGEQSANAGELITAHPIARAEHLKSKVKRHSRILLLALALLILLGVGLAYFIMRSPLPPKVTTYNQITKDGLQKGSNSFASLVTDGSRIYFSESVDEQRVIAQVSITGGETVPIPAPLPSAHVKDLSPSRSELLVDSGVGVVFESPLWIVPVLGGAPRRVGEVMSHAAAWTPDGRRIVYANGSTLYMAKSDGTESRPLVTVAGRPLWLRWSPDGSRLRFTVRDTVFGASDSLWEVAADGSNLHPLLPGWNKPANECCGNWTVDGRYFVFQSTRNGMTNIWARREQTGLFRRASSEPAQLTMGPLNYSAPLPSLDGKRVFVIGEQRRGELSRYDTKTQQWGSFLSGISAEHLDFSRDGAWVVYVTYPEGNLWQSKVDGSERRQLTYSPMQVGLPRWSPNGKQIAFSARAPGKPLKAYLISAEGGVPQQLTLENRSESDLSWSHNGKTLVFSDFEAKTIHLLDLSTRQVSKLPGSEGLFSPRWSPDGRYIAAREAVSQGKLMLFDLTTQKWMELSQQSPSYPQWSRDGKYIYFYSINQNDRALFRLRISDRKIERLASLKNFRLAIGSFGAWVGWAPDDSPLVLRDIGSQEIYALEWQTP
jgi:DNA-binding winged helix-turn-helix (wHTH) protein/Tol biopolymer transport system component